MKTFDGTPIATIRNANGIAFNMRLVCKGQGYGRDLAVIHEQDRPMVEFYDSRYLFKNERGAEYGQFVSRYYADTLLKSRNAGLNLDGGVPAWTVDAEAFELAKAIIRNWTH